MRASALPVLIGALTLFGCGDTDDGLNGFIPVDVGFRPDAMARLDTGTVASIDAGRRDGGAPPDLGAPPDTGGAPDVGDLGPTDTGEVDMGAPDLGAPDAGDLDGGRGDAAPPRDGGAADLGGVDGGGNDAGVPATPVYAIDGDLSDWTTLTSSLSNPGFNGTGLFGPDNRFRFIQVHADASFLYIGYGYRAQGNSAIVHFDTQAGRGETSALMFDAWPRLASFTSTGAIDHFVAQFEGQRVQLRDVRSSTSAPSSASMFSQATVSLPNGDRTTELALPWGALSSATAPPRSVTFYGGVYGGDRFGAGDIIPNASSTPAAPGNSIDPMSSFEVGFARGWTVQFP